MNVFSIPAGHLKKTCGKSAYNGWDVGRGIGQKEAIKSKNQKRNHYKYVFLLSYQ